ncbi:MAG TPA: hypothetical protein VGE74_19325 [Gemmata sp.]
MRAAILAAATVAVAVLIGCGGNVPRGTVHGTLKFQGRPLTGATVVFIASDNRTHVLDVKADGTYSVSGVALGPVKVSVQPAAERVSAKGQFDPPSSEAKGVKDEKAGLKSPSVPEPKTKIAQRIPAHYSDAERSGLTFDLKEPDQEWSVDLK